MENMLAFHTHQRLSLVDVLSHPFFQKSQQNNQIASKSEIEAEMLTRKGFFDEPERQ